MTVAPQRLAATGSDRLGLDGNRVADELQHLTTGAATGSDRLGLDPNRDRARRRQALYDWSGDLLNDRCTSTYWLLNDRGALNDWGRRRLNSVVDEWGWLGDAGVGPPRFDVRRRDGLDLEVGPQRLTGWSACQRLARG